MGKHPPISAPQPVSFNISIAQKDISPNSTSSVNRLSTSSKSRLSGLNALKLSISPITNWLGGKPASADSTSRKRKKEKKKQKDDELPNISSPVSSHDSKEHAVKVEKEKQTKDGGTKVQNRIDQLWRTAIKVVGKKSKARTQEDEMRRPEAMPMSTTLKHQKEGVISYEEEEAKPSVANKFSNKRQNAFSATNPLKRRCISGLFSLEQDELNNIPYPSDDHLPKQPPDMHLRPRIGYPNEHQEDVELSNGIGKQAFKIVSIQENVSSASFPMKKSLPIVCPTLNKYEGESDAGAFQKNSFSHHVKSKRAVDSAMEKCHSRQKILQRIRKSIRQRTPVTDLKNESSNVVCAKPSAQLVASYSSESGVENEDEDCTDHQMLVRTSIHMQSLMAKCKGEPSIQTEDRSVDQQSVTDLAMEGSLSKNFQHILSPESNQGTSKSVAQRTSAKKGEESKKKPSKVFASPRADIVVDGDLISKTDKGSFCKVEESIQSTKRTLKVTPKYRDSKQRSKVISGTSNRRAEEGCSNETKKREGKRRRQRSTSSSSKASDNRPKKQKKESPSSLKKLKARKKRKTSCPKNSQNTERAIKSQSVISSSASAGVLGIEKLCQRRPASDEKGAYRAIVSPPRLLSKFNSTLRKFDVTIGSSYGSSYSPMASPVSAIKVAERIKAVDGSFLTCFFTKVYCFSNHFYRSNLMEVDGVNYICVEQYYMFYKAKVFGDMQAANRIMYARAPASMKKIGSSIANFDHNKWRPVAMQVMVIGALRKFEQNSDLRQHLFNTAGSTLVEASPSDRFWGVGLGMKSPAIRDIANWRGKNVLGKILTIVREKLMQRDEFSTTRRIP